MNNLETARTVSAQQVEDLSKLAPPNATSEMFHFLKEHLRVCTCHSEDGKNIVVRVLLRNPDTGEEEVIANDSVEC